jgi:MFS family permease
MQLWAIFWHIRTLSSQPIVVSGIGLARLVPVLLFSLIGGMVADRHDRRRVMFITQTTMTLVAVLLGVLTITGTIQIWHIYLLTAIQAAAAAFDLPARQSLVPNLVPIEDLPNALSMQSIAFDLGAIVGPALSGLVIGTLGQDAVYFINAASFLALLFALFQIGSVPQQTQPANGLPVSGRQAIQEGIRFIFTRPIIVSTMILDFFATFFSSANTLLPYIARDVLHVGAIAYGWLSSAQSIGAVAAALFLSQQRIIRRQGPVMLIAVTVFGIGTILFGLSRSFTFTMLSLILVGGADAVSTVIRNTIRQMQTPDYMRGRMVGINQIFFSGGPQLGEVEAGLVAQALGSPFAILSGGIGCLVAVGLIGARWPQIRSYDGSEPMPEE